MKQPTIDPSRIDALRLVCGREKAALEAATDALAHETSASSQLRREILVLERRVTRGAEAEIEAKRKQRAAVDRRIGELGQHVDAQRVRVAGAMRLRRRCEDYLAGRA